MKTGIIIALAWPETTCKQAGAWYDFPLKLLGINKNNSYKVGHAALVLINISSGKCHYFDFGRYHAPYQYGRVRSEITDHDLEIKTKALFDENQNLENLNSILEELHINDSCHGYGSLHASYCKIDFMKALNKAHYLQSKSPIKYGPFIPSGTNCSRFVNTVIMAGKPNLKFMIALAVPKTVTPSPLSNVKALEKHIIKYKSVDLQDKSHFTYQNQFAI